MTMSFTKRKEEIYNSIIAYKKEHGFPPSIRELGHMVNLSSTSTVHQHLIHLEKLGYIKVHKAIPRGIQVLDRHESI